MFRLFASLVLAVLAGSAAAAPTASCTARHFLDSATGSCQPCPREVQKCTSATVATECVRGRYLNKSGACVNSAQCDPGTFAQKTTKTCKPCFAPSYATCTDERAYKGTSCFAGYCLNSGGRCQPVTMLTKGSYCNAGHIENCTGTGVATCTAAGALSWRGFHTQAGYILYKSACYADCPSGTVRSADKQSCEEDPCAVGKQLYPDLIWHIIDQGACISCTVGQSSWSPYAQTCVKTCPDTAARNADGSITPATYIDGGLEGAAYQCNAAFPGSVSSCYNSYLFSDGTCVEYDTCFSLRGGSARYVDSASKVVPDNLGFEGRCVQSK
ncbi:Extracellular matrix protein fras1 [Rhodosporidiobolus nylandii]